MGSNYRIYRLDRVRQVVEVDWGTFDSDAEAIAAARALPNAGKREIWHGERLVATIDVEAAGEPSAAFWL